MFKQMSNREFSDWLADRATVWENGTLRGPGIVQIVNALREASQRIKSSAEFQFDVRVTPKWEDQ